jgi:hypothetical protein
VVGVGPGGVVVGTGVVAVVVVTSTQAMIPTVTYISSIEG